MNKFVLALCPLLLQADPGSFPIEDNAYDSEGTRHEVPFEGDSSFTDDVDLDTPGVEPPEFQETPQVTPPKNLAEELVVDLKNPQFSQGTISTEEGGVITGPLLRIQAQKIAYTNRVEQGIHVQKIVAEGDLLMEYAGRAFVGRKLEFDFVSKTGVIHDGKTFVDIWFLGGDRIEIKEDGSLYVCGAFITTSENQESVWDINAHRIKITEDRLLAARNIRFRFLKIPLFVLPSFRANLGGFSDTPVRYRVVWDKGLGPRLTLRYRALSWEELNLFLRLDYRLTRGVGGAVETEYFSKDKQTTFVTRSYGAKDKEFPNEQGPTRYRFQGLYHKDSLDERTQVHLSWDKLSDSRMVGDFKSDDFEINTEKRTRFFASHKFDVAFSRINVEGRANPFDSIDQQLPLFFTVFNPLPLGNSGILSTNTFSAGYLNYMFANDLREEFHKLGLQSSTKSGRIETRNTLYRPFSMGPFTLTPKIGVIGIFYSNTPSSHVAWQGIGQYGFHCKAPLYRKYQTLIHQTIPYLNFQGLTSPTTPLSAHFYFDLNDGFHQLNEMRIGWKNVIQPLTPSRFFPSLSLDLYTLGFLGNRAFSNTFYKTFFLFEWIRPSYLFKGGVTWNNQENVWDTANIGADITINEDIAFGIEMRHRSRFNWRKADHENYILDVSRPISELLESPLSDGRNTLLTRSFFRLAPKWNLHIVTRTGWGRKNEPAYNAMKFDLNTLLTCSWQLRLSYERMPNDDRFSTNISLVK
ncbi:MAG: hypothetical protein RLZZ453_336 [Chlamydiota bacterium]|jgi:hypothetical protein